MDLGLQETMSCYSTWILHTRHLVPILVPEIASPRVKIANSVKSRWRTNGDEHTRNQTQKHVTTTSETRLHLQTSSKQLVVSMVYHLQSQNLLATRLTPNKLQLKEQLYDINRYELHSSRNNNRTRKLHESQETQENYTLMPESIDTVQRHSRRKHH